MKNIFLLIIFNAIGSYAQILGCTDPLAKNFDAKATENNGSCWYASAKVKVVFSKKLSDSIIETSGLIAFDDLLWTHNDDNDTTVYGMNLEGKIEKKIDLNGVKNKDWEEISQDSLYLYLGDFGNNLTGNRTNLKILRIEKKAFLRNAPIIDTIAFSYANQSDFRLKKANTTDFDCEALVVLQDSIYLFTKQWKTNKSSVYSLPKDPGKYQAKYKETLNVQGLITGATALPDKKKIVLTGYSKTLQPFFYLLYDYKKNDFLTGNKRKIKIKLPFHQIEGIATEDGKLFYVTNEATIKKPLVNTPAKISSVDLSLFFKE